MALEELIVRTYTLSRQNFVDNSKMSAIHASVSQQLKKWCQLIHSIKVPVNFTFADRVENPVRARKVGNSLVTTLRIVEERHLGSLTCHLLRSRETEELYQHFIANSSTVFRE